MHLCIPQQHQVIIKERPSLVKEWLRTALILGHATSSSPVQPVKDKTLSVPQPNLSYFAENKHCPAEMPKETYLHYEVFLTNVLEILKGQLSKHTRHLQTTQTHRPALQAKHCFWVV